MNVVILGATGMVRQSVLPECLLDPDVQRVLAEEFDTFDNLSAMVAEMRLHGLAKACKVG